MRVKLQLVLCTDDGREEIVTDIVTLRKDSQCIEHLGLTLAEAAEGGRERSRGPYRRRTVRRPGRVSPLQTGRNPPKTSTHTNVQQNQKSIIPDFVMPTSFACLPDTSSEVSHVVRRLAAIFHEVDNAVDDPDLNIHAEHSACVPIQRDWLSHAAAPAFPGCAACAAGLPEWRRATSAAGPCGRPPPERWRWPEPLPAE